MSGYVLTATTIHKGIAACQHDAHTNQTYSFSLHMQCTDQWTREKLPGMGIVNPYTLRKLELAELLPFERHLSNVFANLAHPTHILID